MADPALVAAAACHSAGVGPPAEAGAIRQGLAQVASGAAIATCWSARGPSGVLARAATVSLAPPRLVLCFDKSAAGHDDLLAADALGLSLLPAEHGGLAETFGGAAVGPRFDPARWRLEPARPPELRDALAAFAGFVRCRIDAGPATVVILDVSAAAFAGETAPGLPASRAH